MNDQKTILIYSKILHKRIKIDRVNKIATVIDRKLYGSGRHVVYTQEELRAIHGEITTGVHLVKNIFDGEIIKGEI